MINLDFIRQGNHYHPRPEGREGGSQSVVWQKRFRNISILCTLSSHLRPTPLLPMLPNPGQTQPEDRGLKGHKGRLEELRAGWRWGSKDSQNHEKTQSVGLSSPVGVQVR